MLSPVVDDDDDDNSNVSSVTDSHPLINGKKKERETIASCTMCLMHTLDRTQRCSFHMACWHTFVIQFKGLNYRQSTTTTTMTIDRLVE